ncbi:MAG: hypothetical protein ORO03_09130, partial [Alphaproteobacteria bacterium]|nr:hypothetical protein [Alphaproteobacteria bacterium]
VGVELAMKLFVLISLVSFGVGGILLHRYLWQRESLWSLLGFQFLLGRSLLWGFLNFLFAAGLAMIILALWLSWRENRPRMAHLVLGLGAIAVYFSHFVGFGILAALVASVALVDAYQSGIWHWRRFIALGGCFAIPLLLFVVTYFAQKTGTAGANTAAVTAIHFGNYWRKLDLPFSLFKAYSPILDGAAALSFVGLIAYGIVRHRLALSPLILFPLGVLVVLYFVMPESILSATLVDQRIPLFIVLVATAGTLPLMAYRGYAAVSLAAFALLFGLRLAEVATVWSQQDTELREARMMIASLPTGAKIATQLGSSDRGLKRENAPFDHLVTLAVIDRNALVGGLFSSPSQQPLRYRQQMPEVATADYLLLLGTGGLPTSLRQFKPLRVSLKGTMKLYKIE